MNVIVTQVGVEDVVVFAGSFVVLRVSLVVMTHRCLSHYVDCVQVDQNIVLAQELEKNSVIDILMAQS